MEVKHVGKYLFKIRCNWENEVNKTQLFLEDTGGYNERFRRLREKKEDCNDTVMEVVWSTNSKLRV
jgi:hypothetical protein